MVRWLHIIWLVEVSSGALVNVAGNAIENVVRLKPLFCLFSVSAGGSSFLYRLFGNLRAFICPRISWITVICFDIIWVVFGQAAALGVRDSCVCNPSAYTWANNKGIQKFSSVLEISKSQQICFSVSETASV